MGYTWHHKISKLLPFFHTAFFGFFATQMARVKSCVLKQACSSPPCRFHREEPNTILKTRIRDARARIRKTRQATARKALQILCSLKFTRKHHLVFSDDPPLYCDHVKIVESGFARPLYIAVSDSDKNRVEWIAIQLRQFLPDLCRVFVGVYDDAGCNGCPLCCSSPDVQRKRRQEGFAAYKECMAVFDSEEEAKRHLAKCS